MSDREDPAKPDAAEVAEDLWRWVWARFTNIPPYREPIMHQGCATMADAPMELPAIGHFEEALRAYACAVLTKLAVEYREKREAAASRALGVRQLGHHDIATRHYDQAEAWREAAEMADRAAGKEGA